MDGKSERLNRDGKLCSASLLLSPSFSSWVNVLLAFLGGRIFVFLSVDMSRWKGKVV